MAWQPKLQRYRRFCERCGALYLSRHTRQRFCGRSCAALSLPAGFVAERGQCAGRKSAASREARAVAALRQSWPGITDAGVAAFRDVVRRQYQSGWRAGRRCGWREALKESA